MYKKNLILKFLLHFIKTKSKSVLVNKLINGKRLLLNLIVTCPFRTCQVFSVQFEEIKITSYNCSVL